MHIQLHHQDFDSSPWMDDFIKDRVNKLSRYLNPAASIHVNLKMVRNRYVTTLAIHNQKHDYAFSMEGENLYESMSSTIDKAMRVLSEEKKKIKDRIHRRYAGADALAS